MVRISLKPVNSKTSLTTSFGFFTTMVPRLFMVLEAMSRTRRPEDEI